VEERSPFVAYSRITRSWACLWYCNVIVIVSWALAIGVLLEVAVAVEAGDPRDDENLA
jgi:hypothetical protein